MSLCTYDPHLTSGTVSDVYVAGNYAYVTLGSSGLEVIDVSAPAQPVRVGGVLKNSPLTDIEAWQVQVVSNYAYVADGGAGLVVLDVSSASQPARVGGYNTSGTAFDLRVVDNRAYVADSFGGLQIIDVSNPARPVRLSGYRTSGMAGGVYVVGTYAYVSDRDFGLQVLEVSNPSRPVRVGSYAYKMDLAAGLEVAENYAFVCHSGEGLLVIEVSNPANPVLVGGYKGTYGAFAVQVVGNTVYVVDHVGGLAILEVNTQAPLRMNPPVRSGDKLNLSWNGGMGIQLQTTPNLTAPNWQDVPGTDGASGVELQLTDPSADANTYVTGSLWGTVTFGGATLTSAGTSDVFIAKLDPEGNLLWVKQVGGLAGDEGYAIAVDSRGYVYVTGDFGEVVNFDGIKLVESGVNDIFIAKLDAVAYGPPLTIQRAGTQAVITWSTNAIGFGLQTTPSVASPASWQDLQAAPAVLGDQNTLVEEASSGQKFYRLRKP